MDIALSRIAADRGGVQAQAIRRALKQGGAVSRSEVYEIGQFPSTRKLRGFTRPVLRVVQDMRDAGEIPTDAVDLLETIYDTGPQASSFRSPAALVEFLDD